MYKTAVDTVFYIYVIVQSHRNVYISRLYMDYFDSFTRNSMKASENREDQDRLCNKSCAHMFCRTEYVFVLN